MTWRQGCGLAVVKLFNISKNREDISERQGDITFTLKEKLTLEYVIIFKLNSHRNRCWLFHVCGKKFFNTNGHKGIHNIKVYMLDFIYAHPESKRPKSLRNTIEFGYIHRIGMNAPKGMNVLDNRYG